MATAPPVQNINDLIAQYTTAFKPQFDQIDQEAGANEASGTAQVAGLDQAKTNAFNDITQRANNNGMFFSGQGIENQGRYTGATYLPALAKVQGAIAGVRNTLFGKKADLYTSANTNAINTHQQQQSAYDQWVQEQEKMAADAAENEKQRAFQANQAALDRRTSAANSARSASAKAPTAAQVRSSDVGTLSGLLKGKAGKDGFVSPASYQNAKNEWVSAGYGSKDFDSTFGNYRNPRNKYYKLG